MGVWVNRGVERVGRGGLQFKWDSFVVMSSIHRLL